MPPLYKSLGYAGVLPFVACTITLFFVTEFSDEAIISLVQLAYGSMILSFLAGVHWAQAINPRNENTNTRRHMIVAMAPTILCLGLFILPVYTQSYEWSLFALAHAFIFTYSLDAVLLNTEDLPEGYLSFRLKVTGIVFVCLLCSAFIVWM